MASKRQQILEAIQERLQRIQVSNGYQTDAGDSVALGEAPTLTEDDPVPQLAIVVGDDEIEYVGENVSVALPIEVQILADASREDAYLVIERGIADVKQAMETDDRRLTTTEGKKLLTGKGMMRGSTRTLPREEGSTTVGAAIGYVLPYSEAWGGS